MKRLLAALLLAPAVALAGGFPWGSGGGGGKAYTYTGVLAGIPATCTVGQTSFITDAAAGQNAYYCTATNTWTQQLNSGGTITTPVNAQTGTTYTILAGDQGKLVTFSNLAAIAVTLPQAGVSFPSGWDVQIQNRGAGTVTITPTTSTIDGAVSLALTTGQGVFIASDGTNYYTVRGTGGMVYPGAGIPQSTGSAWGASITAGTGVVTAMGVNIGSTGGLMKQNGTHTAGDLAKVDGSGGIQDTGIAASSLRSFALNTGASRTMANGSEIYVCTTTCTFTPEASPTAGDQFCVQNGDNVATVITIAATAGVQYETTARTSYKTANTAIASSGAVKDQICYVAISATQWNVFSSTGTWN